MTLYKLLREGFGAFQLRRCWRWAEAAQSSTLKGVNDPCHQRRFRVNYREIDRIGLGKVAQCGQVGHLNGDMLCPLQYARPAEIGPTEVRSCLRS